MPGLLDGIRVLDLTIWRPGPYATQLLAEIGADVIKVEPPGGDPMRTFPELFASLNANKRSVVLDLKSAGGRARALALATDADVVIEGWRPGVAARLGVADADVRAVNPSVVYCSLSGLGQDGPLVDAPGHDLSYLAWAGALSPEGGAPREPAVPVADLSGGMAAALGVCAALVRKLRTGEGEYVDVAMTDVLATWTGAASPRSEGTDPDARGVPGYGTFDTADGGHLTLSVLTEDHFWRAVCETLGLADDLAALGFVDRMARTAELQSSISDAIALRKRDELVDAFLAAGAPCAPVLDRVEMLKLEQFRARGVATSDPWLDPAIGYPIKLREHPAMRTSPPPEPGQHQDATFH
jgi:crotonobetainyl-CoA:carnitine CoA-transferase CaiB-like acyl-CoA transferase